jgi:hypothetical protein
LFLINLVSAPDMPMAQLLREKKPLRFAQQFESQTTKLK